MGRRFVSGCAVLAVLAGLLTVGSAAPGAAATTTTGNYIVVLTDSAGDAGVVASQHAAKYAAKVGFVYRHALKGYSVAMPAALVSALRADPRVALVAPDEPVSAAGQYVGTSIRRIQADQSSTHSGDGTGSVNVEVAVLDTGIDVTQPDLNVLGGVDCANSMGRSFSDDNGHGTQVAGLIGARDNAIGVVGVAPGARLWAVKVLGKNGMGSTSNILCGLDWVTGTRTDADPTNDISVANMSLAGNPNKSVDDGNCGLIKKNPLHQAICRSVAAGVTYVVAAGNNTADVQYVSPAAYDEVLTVTAMADRDGLPGGAGGTECTGDADDTPAFFSNFATLASDQAHTLSAPGTCLATLYPLAKCATPENPQPTDCFASGTGTSFASPLVAGTVALCIASGQCAGLTVAQIRQKIVNDDAAYNVANPAYGFTGDPLRPIAGKYYGYLVRAAAY